MASLRKRCEAKGIRYVTRFEWGARSPKYRNPMPNPVDGIVWHHTVTALAPEVAQMQAVQAYHMDARGWSDFAYSLAVGQSGNVYEGRSAEAFTHGMLARPGGTGDPEDGHLLCCVAIGDFHTLGRDIPSTMMMKSLGVIAGWVLEELGAEDQFRDRDFNLTACCGDRLATRTPVPPIPYLPKPPPDPGDLDVDEATLRRIIGEEVDAKLAPVKNDVKALRVWSLPSGATKDNRPDVSTHTGVGQIKRKLDEG